MLNLPSRFFITGTDTEIGKTYIACYLLQKLRQENRNAEAIKPLVSGGLDDINLLSKNSTGVMQRYLYYFDLPIAPHIAAEIDNIIISPTEVIRFMRQEVKSDYLIIEGFGGWYAPISYQQTMAECVKSAEIPVVMVVGMKLGCINHALMTARAIESDGCKLHAWIANTLPNEMPYLHQNIETISRLLGSEPIIIV